MNPPIESDILESHLETTVGASSGVISLWHMQLVFWITLTVMTFFSLTLWYGDAELSHVIHTLLQSLLGLIIAWPMDPLYRSLWKWNVWARLFVTAISRARLPLASTR